MPALAHLQPDHDEMLIARLAADDVSESEVAAATQLVAGCPACAQIHADLRSIIAATATLPAPRRTRDFRLTQADAARLQGSGWRRFLGRFGDPGLAFTRPLATGLVTLGIAGLLLSAAPSFMPSLGSPASAPAVAPGAGGVETTGSTAGGGQGAGSPVFGADSGGNAGDGINAAASAPPPPLAVASSPAVPPPSAPAAVDGSTQPTARAAASSATDLGNGTVGVVASPPGAPVIEQNPGVGKATVASAETTSGPSPLLLASLVLVLLGIALFGLRWMARRTA